MTWAKDLIDITIVNKRWLIKLSVERLWSRRLDYDRKDHNQNLPFVLVSISNWLLCIHGYSLRAQYRKIEHYIHNVGPECYNITRRLYVASKMPQNMLYKIDKLCFSIVILTRKVLFDNQPQCGSLDNTLIGLLQAHDIGVEIFEVLNV